MEYLVHYGVRGMRWGVRKQQKNFSKLVEKGKIDKSDFRIQNAAKKLKISHDKWLKAYDKSEKDTNRLQKKSQK